MSQNNDDDPNPFVTFEGMSERKTPVVVKGENLPDLISQLVKLIDSNIQINFDHHTSNVRHWEDDN